jgi:hypothetical protein
MSKPSLVKSPDNFKNPDNFKRNKWGLLEGVKYKFRDDNTVDWRAMIKSEYTVFNSQLINEIQQKYLKAIKDIKVEEVDDKYLLVLLAGFKELASIRGYTSVTYNIAHAAPDYAATSCRIEWIPNFETLGEKLIFESMADASIATTTGFGQNYLLAMAENRAFCRCVRNALGIHIIAFDEISSKIITSNSNPVAAASTMLKTVLDEKNISFDKLKEQWINLGNEEAKKWTTLEDISSETIFRILGKIKRK